MLDGYNLAATEPCVVAFARIRYASRPNRVIDGEGLAPSRFAALPAAPGLSPPSECALPGAPKKYGRLWDGRKQVARCQSQYSRHKARARCGAHQKNRAVFGTAASRLLDVRANIVDTKRVLRFCPLPLFTLAPK